MARKSFGEWLILILAVIAYIITNIYLLFWLVVNWLREKLFGWLWRKK